MYTESSKSSEKILTVAELHDFRRTIGTLSFREGNDYFTLLYNFNHTLEAELAERLTEGVTSHTILHSSELWHVLVGSTPWDDSCCPQSVETEMTRQWVDKKITAFVEQAKKEFLGVNLGSSERF